jgi:hypothetical protein
MFRDIQKMEAAFAGVAAHRGFQVNLAFSGKTPIRSAGWFVSGSYFPVLGLRPVIGRLLGPKDDGVIGEPLVAVLQYSDWRDHFGASPDVRGKTLTVNGHALTIVGVAPEGFTGTNLNADPSVYVPITLREKIEPGRVKTLGDRRYHWLYAFARLKPGISMEQASVAVNTPYRNILAEVEAPLQEGITAQELSEFKAKPLIPSNGK